MLIKNIWGKTMKRIITVFAVILLAFLCSCGGAPDQASLTRVLRQPYEAVVAVNEGGSVYTAAVSYDGAALSFEFSEPELLRGISYGFEDGKSRVTYNDISIPVELADTDGGISGGVLVWKDMLEANGEYTVRRAGDGQRKQYALTDGKTEYRFDADKNTPVFIKCGDITITFTDFKVKNDKTSEGAG